MSLLYLIFEILFACFLLYGIFLIVKFFFEIKVDIKGVTLIRNNSKIKKVDTHK